MYTPKEIYNSLAACESITEAYYNHANGVQIDLHAGELWASIDGEVLEITAPTTPVEVYQFMDRVGAFEGVVDTYDEVCDSIFDIFMDSPKLSAYFDERGITELSAECSELIKEYIKREYEINL